MGQRPVGRSERQTSQPGTSESPRSPVLMLAVATVGFAVNFWAWALISPLGPMFRDQGTLGALTESDVALLVAVPVLVGSLGRMRQTLIALVAGRSLGEHESPGEASLQVLVGTVRLTAGDEVWEGGPGGHVVIPPKRHDLHAETDAVVLLTVATRA